jgi:hypothetical protein
VYNDEYVDRLAQRAMQFKKRFGWISVPTFIQRNPDVCAHPTKEGYFISGQQCLRIFTSKCIKNVLAARGEISWRVDIVMQS